MAQEAKMAPTKTERVIPKIPREAVTRQSAGSCWKTWRVRLPNDFTMQDLQDYPAIWKGIQSDRNIAVSLDDRITIVAFDRSFAADYVVMDASPTEVVLSKPVVLWSGRDAGMGIKWQDEKFEIEYAGTGYAVFRKAEGNRPRHLIRDGYTSLTPAKAMVAKQYPRQVA